MRYELTNSRRFVRVENRFYGGNQSWLHEYDYISKYWADRACGTVAATNLLIHLSKADARYVNLVDEMDLTKENYTRTLKDVYEYVKPKFYGIPTTNQMIHGVLTYAKSRGVPLVAHEGTKKWEYTHVLEYIIEGMQSNCPILMVTWNTKIKGLGRHWVTITAIEEKEGNYFLEVSNYGRKQKVNLREWVEEKSFYNGLIYFK